MIREKSHRRSQLQFGRIRLVLDSMIDLIVHDTLGAPRLSSDMQTQSKVQSLSLIDEALCSDEYGEVDEGLFPSFLVYFHQKRDPILPPALHLLLRYTSFRIPIE